MSGQTDIFGDRRALEADLLVQECLLWARSALSARITEASLERNPELLEALRIEAMYQFCEFFYLIKARRIATATQIRNLAEIHNEHLENLSMDSEKMRRLGLRKDRVLDAIFTADTMPRLIEVWRQSPGKIDQSNLARFLMTVMSTETCRKLTVAAARAGFLERERSAFGTVLVSSTGVMEQVFGSILRDLRTKIAAIASENGSKP